MRAGIALTNNKEICRGIIQSTQVQLHNIFPFLITDPLDDQVIQFFRVWIAVFSPLNCCQIQILRKISDEITFEVWTLWCVCQCLFLYEHFDALKVRNFASFSNVQHLNLSSRTYPSP